MIFSLRAMEVGFVALWAWCVWHFFIQPYRREGRFSFDGLLCMALFVFAFFQDPLANYGGAVFTYNAELVNFGSWLNEVPGAVTPGQPGAQLPEPLWTAADLPRRDLRRDDLGLLVHAQGQGALPGAWGSSG